MLQAAEDVRFGGFTEALKLCGVNPSASVRCSSSRLRLLIPAPDVAGSCLEDVRFGGFTEALKLCVVNPSSSVRCSSSRLRLLIPAPDVAGSALEDVTGTRAPGQFHIALCVRGSGLFCCEPSLERTRCFC